MIFDNLILVDLKSILSRGAFQANMGELKNAITGMYTGGAVYFFNTLSREIRRVVQSTGQFPYIVICDDLRYEDGKLMRDLRSGVLLGGSMYKKDRTPHDGDNKRKRDDSQDLIYRFVEDCTVISNVHRVEGMEADDLIADLINKFEFNKALIVSNDGDLDCLLKGRRVLRTKLNSSDNTAYRTEHTLLESVGLRPDQVQAYHALSGGHNNIPRIKKLGAQTAIADKTALKLLTTGVDLKSYLDYDCYHPFIENQTINGYKLFLANMEICKLPIVDNLPDWEGYEYGQIPDINQIGGYFKNTLGLGYDRSLELAQLFNEFNSYWLSQRPENGNSSFSKLLGSINS